MNIGILLGLVGILVSIGVGFGTFYLADKRARINRWQNAKDMVLRDLSKSLGEGNVPDASVIKATIRSVLRSHNAIDLSVVTLDEIADDLLRQITADPFLEPERRKQLQSDVLELRESQIQIEKAMSAEGKEAEAKQIETGDRLLTWSTLSSLFAGIAASAIAAGSLTSIKPLLERIKQSDPTDLSIISVTVIAVAVTVLISVLSIIITSHEKKKKIK